MRILCATTFLDGTVRFEKDDVVTVPDSDGQRFIDNGWAVREGDQSVERPELGSISLNIQSAAHATKAVTHG